MGLLAANLATPGDDVGSNRESFYAMLNYRTSAASCRKKLQKEEDIGARSLQLAVPLVSISSLLPFLDHIDQVFYSFRIARENEAVRRRIGNNTNTGRHNPR